MNRRQFLQGSLTLAGLSLVGCPSRRAPAPEGAVVGASWQRGHRLREASEPKTGQRLRTDVAILGGGVAGLSAAWRLRRAGLEEFLLLELESDLGGNSRAATYPASRAPWGAHYLPVPTPDSRAVIELLKELEVMNEAGQCREEYLCHEPQERLYLHGRWQDGLFPNLGATRRDLQELQEFQSEIERLRLLRDRRGRPAFALPAPLSSPDWLEFDGLSMQAFIEQKGWTSRRLRWWLEYACRDDFGCSLENTSAWAGLHYHAARPAEDQLLVWPEGNAWLTDRLAAPLQERARTDCLVRSVRTDGQRVITRVEHPEGAFEVESRRAVFCLPTFLRRFVLEGAAPEPFTYAPWAVANLVLQRGDEGACWDNVLYDSPSLGYVVATHQSLTTRPGPTVWTWYRPLTGDPMKEREGMLARPWESWRQEIVSELSRPHPDLVERLSRLDVMLLGHAMVRPVPGLRGSGALETVSRPRKGVHFAHSDLSGFSLFEEANYHGVRAAEEVLAALGVRSPSLL